MTNKISEADVERWAKECCDHSTGVKWDEANEAFRDSYRVHVSYHLRIIDARIAAAFAERDKAECERTLIGEMSEAAARDHLPDAGEKVDSVAAAGYPIPPGEPDPFTGAPDPGQPDPDAAARAAKRIADAAGATYCRVLVSSIDLVSIIREEYAATEAALAEAVKRAETAEAELARLRDAVEFHLTEATIDRHLAVKNQHFECAAKCLAQMDVLNLVKRDALLAAKEATDGAK